MEENKMKTVLAELIEHIKNTSKEKLEKEFLELEEWCEVGPTVSEYMEFVGKINKKPTYPKTYEECKDIVEATFAIVKGSYKTNLFRNFYRLFICRNAYWKIAGERMGLGKPWEPDWNDSMPKYTIVVIGNDLVKHYTLAQNFILAFPTKEIRNTFYDNFKDLIEQCKELL